MCPEVASVPTEKCKRGAMEGDAPSFNEHLLERQQVQPGSATLTVGLRATVSLCASAGRPARRKVVQVSAVSAQHREGSSLTLKLL